MSAWASYSCSTGESMSTRNHFCKENNEKKRQSDGNEGQLTQLIVMFLERRWIIRSRGHAGDSGTRATWHSRFGISRLGLTDAYRGRCLTHIPRMEVQLRPRVLGLLRVHPVRRHGSLECKTGRLGMRRGRHVWWGSGLELRWRNAVCPITRHGERLPFRGNPGWKSLGRGSVDRRSVQCWRGFGGHDVGFNWCSWRSTGLESQLGLDINA